MLSLFEMSGENKHSLLFFFYRDSQNNLCRELLLWILRKSTMKDLYFYNWGFWCKQSYAVKFGNIYKHI